MCENPIHGICNVFNEVIAIPGVNIIMAIVHGLYHQIQSVIDSSREYNDTH